MRDRPVFKPDSSRGQSKGDGSPSCLLILFVSLGGYIVYSAIDRVLSGYGNAFEQIICWGTLIGLAIFVIVAKRQEDRDKRMIQEAQQEWKRTCRSVEVAIVAREYYAGGSWEDSDEIPHYSRPRYYLELEPTVDQRVVFPNLRSVRVDVYENIYSNLIDRNTVRVYYQSDSPMTFLLEEELE